MASRNAVSTDKQGAAARRAELIDLPYLVLLKLRASRGVDIGDLTRMLGGADEASLARVRAVIGEYEAGALEDLDSLVQIGRLEHASEGGVAPSFGARAVAAPLAPKAEPESSDADVTVHEHQRAGRTVHEHRRRRASRRG